MTHLQTLQEFIYPQADYSFGSKKKYLRANNGYYHDSAGLALTKTSSINFNTYYNAFSGNLWFYECGISKVSLFAKGIGKIRLKIWQSQERSIDLLLVDIIVDLASIVEELVELDIKNIAGSLIYPEIIALTDVKINKLTWVTKEQPKRAVKLGIVITHFNRKQYVLPAIARIKKALLEDEFYKDKLQLIVIDNSQNIAADESHGVTIIANENTGGSGGFTRGFLHYKNNTDCTHCAFMDDDTSLEIESIKRAYVILQYAIKDNSTVGASLFLENYPDICIEHGAIFNGGGWSPLYHLHDSINLPVLHKNSGNYLGWWFCAFPIAYAKKMTLPFFVRGDDVLFSLINDLNLITTNGIGCFAEKFSAKISISTTYLDTRNKLILNALLIDSPFRIIKYFIKHYGAMLLSLRYDHLQATRLAVQHFTIVDANWLVSNANMKDIFVELKKIETSKAENIDLESLEKNEQIVIKHDLTESILRKMLRIVTFNGAFSFCVQNKPILQDMQYRAVLRHVAWFKNILYYNEPSKQGYIVSLDRIKSLKFLFLLPIDILKIYINYGKVKTNLNNNKEFLTSEKMWKDILKLD